VAVVICIALAGGRAGRAGAQSSPELLVQTQAADVLSDLITYAGQQADARVQAMHQYLVQIGKEQAYDQNRPPATREKGIAFSQVFQGAALFARNGGAKYADPALLSMNDSQLTTELTELQVYNIQQFQRLIERRQAVTSMNTYLKSAGSLDGYNQWAKEHAAPANNPAPATPQDVAAQMGEMIGSAKSVAWAKAKERGVSQEEFEKRWKERVAKYRESVDGKIDGVKALAKSLSEPPPPPPAPAPVQNPPPVTLSGPPGIPGGPSLPPTVQSSYTREHYQQQSNELWQWQPYDN
jgi:hypothetical protein